MFQWIGELREFAAVAVPENYRPNAKVFADLDKAVAEHGQSAVEAYLEGRKKTAATAKEYTDQIENSTVTADAAKFRVERRRLVNYAEFPFDDMKQGILEALDQ